MYRQTDRQMNFSGLSWVTYLVPPVINPAYIHLYAAGCTAMNKVPYLPQFSGEIDQLKLKLEISKMQCMGGGGGEG